MPDVRGRLRGAAVSLGVPALVTAGLLLPGAPVHADTGPPERRRQAEWIPVYDVVLRIDRDAVLHVRETITYDFAAGGDRGISRRVPYRRGDRLFAIRNVRAGSSTGAPARPRTMRVLNDLQISVGAQGRKVTGRQAYVIEYEVAGAFTPHAAHDELVWDAVGSGRAVPIGEAAVRVRTPEPPRAVSCRAGTPEAGTPCLRDRGGLYAMEFTQSGLHPQEGMVVRVRLPKGMVDVPPPRYAEPRWAGTWSGTAALGLVLGTAVLVARARPLPGRRAGEVLVTAGVLLIVADVADDVVARGPWAFSVGDPAMAGLAVMMVGGGIGYARGTRRAERAAIAPGEV